MRLLVVPPTAIVDYSLFTSKPLSITYNLIEYYKHFSGYFTHFYESLRNQDFLTNSNFLVQISLQPDGVNL